MKKVRSGAIAMSLLVAASVLVSGIDAAAQEQKGKGKGKGRKKTEQSAEDQEKGREGMKGGREGRARKYRPKGLSEEQMREWKDGMPPGWSAGAKSGWKGSGRPPGQMKKGYPRGAEGWDESRKAEWEGEVEKAKERVSRRVRSADGMTDGDERSAELSVEAAAKEGVPVEHAEATVLKAIEHGMDGEEVEKVTRAVAYGADKDVDYDRLGSFIDSKLEEGQRGDELAVSIYEEIDRSGDLRQEEPEEKGAEKAEEKVPWYKRLFGRGG